MPGPLPFIPLPPAPAPAATNSSTRPRPEPPAETRQRSDDRPDSFSDTVDALDRKEAPKPESRDKDAPSAASEGEGPQTPPEEGAETPLIAVVDPALAPAPVVDGEAEIAPDLLRRAATLPTAEARLQTAQTGAAQAAAATDATTVPRTPVARPLDGALTETPVQTDVPTEELPQQTRPTTAQPAVQTPQLTRAAQTPVELPRGPVTPEAEMVDPALDQIAEPEVELPLPDRNGQQIGTARTPQAQTQTGLTTPVTQTVQTHTPAVETGNATPEETLAAIGQTAAATPLGGTTAIGAAPVQIAQSAANQIIAAVPRDQGVVITNAGTEIALDPPELGRVRMIVTEVAGGLALTVTAERQETLDLFKRHAAMLAQEFAREGFADTNFNFQGDADGNASQEGNSPTSNAIDAADVTAVVQPRASQTGGLDLRL